MIYVVFGVIGVASSVTAAAIGVMLVLIRIVESVDNNNDEEQNEDLLMGSSSSDKD